jgi:hypothetical protein
VDAGERFRYAVIPGIYVSADPAQHHAFVQVLDGTTGRTAYHRYPSEAFVAARDAFDVHIGPNRDLSHRLEIDAMRAVGGALRSPGRTKMGVRVLETLQATAQVRLLQRERGHDTVLLDDIGHHAGLEVVGDLERLRS